MVWDHRQREGGTVQYDRGQEWTRLVLALRQLPTSQWLGDWSSETVMIHGTLAGRLQVVSYSNVGAPYLLPST